MAVETTTKCRTDVPPQPPEPCVFEDDSGSDADACGEGDIMEEHLGESCHLRPSAGVPRSSEASLRARSKDPTGLHVNGTGHKQQDWHKPTVLALVFNRCREVFMRVRQLKDNGILVQGLGIPLRHLLALWGFSLFLRGWVGWRTVLLAVVLWVISGLGVTAGAHRLWTHQSYRASPAMECLLMLMFSMADQGPIRGWSLTHAMHHYASDTGSDPHNRQEGFWHAHFGWLYSVKRFCLSSREHDRVVSGLGPSVLFHDQHYLYWDPLWSHVFPALVASLWGETLNGLLFAGAFRWCFVQHVTFFVNSVAHGEREPGDAGAFDATASGIGPRVSFITTVFALGEGWHDYHHLFPWDYAASELNGWDQWNPTKVFIDACTAVGIVTGRRRCSTDLQEARRRQMLQKGADLSIPGGGKAATACNFKIEGPIFFRRRVVVDEASKQ